VEILLIAFMNLRCFIAIELPDELRESIVSRSAALRKSPAGVRWVRPENIHLTLKFLGKTPEGGVPKIQKELSGALHAIQGFDLRVRGAGAFPGPRRPRVIWVGMEDCETLLHVHERVEQCMAGLGYPPEERRFRAHLTIGRVKDAGGVRSLMRELEALREEEFGSMEVKAVSFMKSELHPSGARYERLFAVKLAG
jgi:2'-5' RNA ligase